jgi:hypothetical protein
MKHLLLLGGLSSLSVLSTAQQKDLFDINRHLKSNKQFSIPSEKAFPLTSGPADPSRLLLQYRLPNGDGIYNQSIYRMPVIIPETDLAWIPNPGLSRGLNKAIFGWPMKSAPGTIPNTAPKTSW